MKWTKPFQKDLHTCASPSLAQRESVFSAIGALKSVAIDGQTRLADTRPDDRCTDVRGHSRESLPWTATRSVEVSRMFKKYSKASKAFVSKFDFSCRRLAFLVTLWSFQTFFLSLGVAGYLCSSQCDRSQCRELENCPGSKVFDACSCCFECAKQVGESCGGSYSLEGTCEGGLLCVIKPPPNGGLITQDLPGVCAGLITFVLLILFLVTFVYLYSQMVAWNLFLNFHILCILVAISSLWLIDWRFLSSNPGNDRNDYQHHPRWYDVG